MALRLREIYPTGRPSIVAQKVSTEFVARLVDEVTTGFRGDVGVVPRQFLREFVTQFDLVDENPTTTRCPSTASPELPMMTARKSTPPPARNRTNTSPSRATSAAMWRTSG